MLLKLQLSFMSLDGLAKEADGTIQFGWLINLLRAATGSVWVAIVVGAAVFGIGHAYQGAKAMLRACFIGLQLAYLFVTVDSLIRHPWSTPCSARHCAGFPESSLHCACGLEPKANRKDLNSGLPGNAVGKNSLKCSVVTGYGLTCNMFLIKCRAFGAHFSIFTQIPAWRPGLRTTGPRPNLEIPNASLQISRQI